MSQEKPAPVLHRGNASASMRVLRSG
jgi:hypothetical protein